MNDQLNFLIAKGDYWHEKFQSPLQTNGYLPVFGKKAPHFVLKNSDLKDVSLDAYLGKRKVLIIIPSLDVPICKAIIQKFYQEQANLKNTVILTISADLPFTQKRFFESQGLSGVITLSTFKSSFAKDYGIQITNEPLAGFMAPAIVIVDENNKVIHSQIVAKLAEELSYELAFSALKPKESNRRGYFRATTLNPCYVDIELLTPKGIESEEYQAAYERAVSKAEKNLKNLHLSDQTLTVTSPNIMRLNVFDISPSGCSMFNNDEEFSVFLELHTVCKNCKIYLSNNSEINVSFKIVSKHPIEKKDIGDFCAKCPIKGCTPESCVVNDIVGVEFINLTNATESTISYFVKEIERKRLSDRSI